MILVDSRQEKGKEKKIKPVIIKIPAIIVKGLIMMSEKLLNLLGFTKNLISQLFCKANFKQAPLAHGFIANTINNIPNNILIK